MFTIAFRSGKDGELVYGARPEYNEETVSIRDKGIAFPGRIGDSFASFISGEWEKHPYMIADPDSAEEVSESSLFISDLRSYIDLCIDNPEFYTESCLMFFTEIRGLEIPAMHYIMKKKEGYENRDVSEFISDNIPALEAAMRGFLSHGSEVYDVPVTVYTCDTIEDACIASLHFMIGHRINIRKCKNCGKYFVAYNRSDAIYCDRQSPFNTSRTCKEDGPLRTYSASVSGDDLKREIRNVTTARRMRVRRNPANSDMQWEFEDWMDKLKEKKKQYRSGEISTQTFMDWLNETRRYEEDY